MTILVLQQNWLHWNVLRKEDNDWVKKCVDDEVQGARPRTWREVVQKHCQASELNREDAMDHSRWTS